ncbi:MAG TPA: hypothetical protein PKD48_01970 [Sphingopyxis sp.]|nr:hypothetical protein [Sphingopyxis sp.]
MNPFKGQAPLNLSDGRSFTLVLDMEGLVEAEPIYGHPLPKIMADAAAGFVGAIRALLFGALRRHHPDITAVEVLEMIRTDMAAVGAALQAATQNAFPKSEGEKSGNAPPVGKTSGANGVKRASTRKPSGSKPRARSR